MIADFRVDKVLLLPLKVDKLLLRWQVEVQQPLDEFGPLKSLQPRRTDQITLTQFQNHRPVPLAPILNTQNSRRSHLVLILRLIDVIIVLIFEVDLVVADHLVIWQAYFGIDEELITVHEQRTEVPRAQCLTCSQDLILGRVLEGVP